MSNPKWLTYIRDYAGHTHTHTHKSEEWNQQGARRNINSSATIPRSRSCTSLSNIGTKKKGCGSIPYGDHFFYESRSQCSDSTVQTKAVASQVGSQAWIARYAWEYKASVQLLMGMPSNPLCSDVVTLVLTQGLQSQPLPQHALRDTTVSITGVWSIQFTGQHACVYWVPSKSHFSAKKRVEK